MFAIPAADYDNFMGRYSTLLAPRFADFVGVAPGMRVLDVGCGPGALTAELARRVGLERVAGVEPSGTFFEACRQHLPNADIRLGTAETLPWADARFDAALCQLALSFVTDEDRVAREMRRVVRPGGCVAACMWLEGEALQIGQLFWESVADVDPASRDRRHSPRFRRPGEIAELWRSVGLSEVEETLLEVRVIYRDFADLWDSVASGAGTIGLYMASASDERKRAIREACRIRLGDRQGALELSGRACAARGRV